MKKIMKGIYWSVELVAEYEVEVEEISSTTTTTKKVIEKTKMYNTKLKLVRRRSKKKEGKSFLVN